MLGYKKGNKKLLTGQIPLHYPGDRVYLDGDPTKNVQDKVARKADLTNLDLTGTTNTTGSTIASGTYFYLNGVLVRAKTAIASGATFTLNTNYEVKTVGDALNDRKTIFGSITLEGTGSNEFNSETFSETFPNHCYYVSLSLARNATDADVLSGKVALRSWNTSSFTYAFNGSNGKSYVLEYMAVGD